MKITRYQTGGGLVYTPHLGGVTEQTTGTTQTTSNTSNAVEKAIIDILKESGLPSDVDAFLSTADKFLSKTGSGDIFNTGYSLHQLIQLQSLANRVKHNSALHKDAVQRLQNQNAGGEVALTHDGKLYVVGKEGLQTITPTEYSQNRDKYQPISNKQLINWREEHTAFANRSDILLDLSHTIGMKDIMSHIHTAINEFGTKGLGNESSALVRKQSSIEHGLKLIEAGPDGLYKIINKEKIATNRPSDVADLNNAIQYIYSTLPTDMKNVLQAKAAIANTDVKTFLATSILRNTDFTQETSIDFENEDGNSGRGGSGGSGGFDDLSRAEKIAYGRGPQEQEYQLHSSADKFAINTWGQYYGQFKNHEGKPLTDLALDSVLRHDPIRDIIDPSSITIGETLLHDGILSRVVLGNDSNIYRVALPYTKDSQGHIIPNLDLLEKIEIFKEWQNEQPGATGIQIQSKMQELGLDGLRWTPQGLEIPKNQLHVFLMTHGYITNHDNIVESDWMEEQHDNEDQLLDYYYDVVNYGGASHTKANKRDNLANRWWRSDKIYKAPIFMPIDDATVATAIHGDILINKSSRYNFGQARDYNINANW